MRRIQVITALLAAMVLLFSCGIEYAAAANDIVQVQVKAEFKYSEARKVLDLVNAFRTGKDAWYLAEDNVTRISASGLGKLKYDYNLERVAMQRALDIAFVAPDGTVIEAHRAVPPNRRLRNRKATATLERFASDGEWYVPGDCIEIIKGDRPDDDSR